MKRILMLLSAVAAVGYAQAPNKCGDLAKIQIPGTKTEITRAEMVAAGQAPPGRGGVAGAALFPNFLRLRGIHIFPVWPELLP